MLTIVAGYSALMPRGRLQSQLLRDNLCGNQLHSHLTVKMASAWVVETSVANNSPSQDSNHPDDHFQSRKFIMFNVC